MSTTYYPEVSRKIYLAARRVSGLARFERTTKRWSIPGTQEHGRWTMLRRVCSDWSKEMHEGTMDLKGNRVAKATNAATAAQEG